MAAIAASLVPDLTHIDSFVEMSSCVSDQDGIYYAPNLNCDTSANGTKE